MMGLGLGLDESECECQDKATSTTGAKEDLHVPVPVPVPVFVDLCGAPGGFSQYLLFRNTSTRIRGYGMSLSGTSDDSVGLEWKVDELNDCILVDEGAGAGAASSLSLGDTSTASMSRSSQKRFKIHEGSDGTGNIQNWDNVISLQQAIEADAICDSASDSDTATATDKRDACKGKWSTDKKATLVVADGGIDAQRNCSDQESIAHRLVCCQVAAALLLLKTGGTFVVKMFGFQTKGTRLMMRFLLNLFDRIQVLKPIASRPASAERYVMFRGFGGFKREHFDLLKWRDGIIDGVLIEGDEEKDFKTVSRSCSGFEEFLDAVDRDMLSLNIRACTNIIEYLRDEEDKLLNGKRRRNGCFGEMDLDLNVEFIKKEWRIPTGDGGGDGDE